MTTASGGMTAEYWQPRDAGELPNGYDAGPLRALARKQCCDYDGGPCIRGMPCVLREDRRCSWFEEAVLPQDTGLRTDLEALTDAPDLSPEDEERVDTIIRAADNLLQGQQWISIADVTREVPFQSRTVERLFPFAIVTLRLRKHGRGRDRWRRAAS